ncbi:DedA family protein [Streptomyces sp. NPDC005483]|uniref:DedA family protein n=1 Tax=Streptomyces sp. NPDC005483 TaxID=3154882 RepID=UPI0033B0967B
MSALSVVLGHLAPSSAYAMLAAAVLLESVLLVGVFIPSFILLATAGALARTDHLDFLPVVAAAGAAVAGDFLGYRTGRLLSGQLRGSRAGRRIPDAAWQRAETLMSRHGGRAIFVARLLPFARTLVPHYAGALRLPYLRIAPYSIGAACLWAATESGLGYAAAMSAENPLTRGGPVAAVLVLVAVVGVVLMVRRRRRVLERRQPTPTAHGSAAAPEQ